MKEFVVYVLLGVDMGKRKHNSTLVNNQREQFGKSIRFSNTKHESEHLLKFTEK
ncbi:hypothetical protein [Bacillus cereus]|uniref:hypothetical protein n=1 Tax=Bacillus cereus TaxID=1396 RepID=UPI0015CF7727|nr:hypothetical protein [Bacillus cereus]